MEASPAATTFAISKSINHRVSLNTRSLPSLGTTRAQLSKTDFLSGAAHLRNSIAVSSVPPFPRYRLECLPNSAGGGEGGGGEGGDGGGGGGSGSGDVKSNLVAGGVEEGSALSSDVIVLNVGGMTCGGCSASVKRILESQPQVSSASVDLATETATVWAISEAKAVPDWRKQLGDELAKHLTSCGFTSNPRGESAAAA